MQHGFGKTSRGLLAFTTPDGENSQRAEDADQDDTAACLCSADDPIAVLKSFNGSIKQVVSAKNHNLALTESGDVWGWGGARYGLLGRICEEKLQTDPDDETEVHARHLKFSPISPLRPSQYRTRPKMMQVFVFDQIQIQIPPQTEAPPCSDHEYATPSQRIVALACASHHSLALSEGGEVWAWGSAQVS